MPVQHLTVSTNRIRANS